MKLAVVGATGLVGSEVLKVLEEFSFPFKELIPVASPSSIGSEIRFAGNGWKVVGIDEAISQAPSIAIFSAGGIIAKEYAPMFVQVGTTVIDNSSAWRMSPECKLIVPEINGDSLTEHDKIIANPNCSTIQMVIALAGLHKAFQIRRIVVSTYQSVTGTGKDAVDQLMNERAGNKTKMVYPYPIDLNAIPQIDDFMDNGYTKEELKMVNETKKIFADNSILVTATAVRLPIKGGHAESINVEFHQPISLEEVKIILSDTAGVILQDNITKSEYPMPLFAQGKNDVFVGRVRLDETQANTLNLWVVADNLRKGAATNAVQIAQHLLANKLVNG